ncbi:MAG: lysophospholipid acyltransferase family protein [Candidatus Sumerlaeia bacterium]
MASAFRKKSLHFLILNLGIPLIYLIFRLVSLTLRHQRLGAWDRVEAGLKSGHRFSAAFFHGDSFMMAREFFQLKKMAGRIYLMVSRSRDGELMARFVGLVGASVMRGSSSRGGGRALLGIAKALKAEDNAGLAVDGPKGPRHEVKEGIVLLARRSGKPIIPIAMHIERKWTFRSWDRMEFPKPFSRSVAMYGEPIPVPADADAEAIENIRKKVEDILLEMKKQNPFDEEAKS